MPGGPGLTGRPLAYLPMTLWVSESELHSRLRSSFVELVINLWGSMRFNRNIIIQDDIERLLDPGRKNPKTLTANPPSGFVPTSAHAAAAPGGGAPAGAAPAAGGAKPAAPGGVAVPSEDDYLTKVVKYVPVEVLAAYLFMAGVIDSNVSNRHDHAVWLGGLLIGVLVLTIPYD